MHHDTPLDESTLRAASLRGEPAAWRILYGRTAPVLRRFLQVRMGGESEQVTEVLQETWMIAVRRLKSFDPKLGSFEVWMKGIAALTLKNFLRRDARRRTLSIDQVEAASAQRGSSAFDEERVAKAMTVIPDIYRTVLAAKYVHGLRVEAIAAHFGRSEKALESLLTRARTAFRKAYEQLRDLNE